MSLLEYLASSQRDASFLQVLGGRLSDQGDVLSSVMSLRCHIFIFFTPKLILKGNLQVGVDASPHPVILGYWWSKTSSVPAGLRLPSLLKTQTCGRTETHRRGCTECRPAAASATCWTSSLRPPGAESAGCRCPGSWRPESASAHTSVSTRLAPRQKEIQPRSPLVSGSRRPPGRQTPRDSCW